MKLIVNLAGYKFVTLHNLPTLREQLKKVCAGYKLKGTILLSEEGININLAGIATDIESFINFLAEITEFSNIQFKKSYSDFIPFKRLLIKIKKEIITFSVQEISPEKNTATKISPEEFNQWLAQNKSMTILDVRNECEISLGKFQGAIDLEIKNFRSFPKAITKLPDTFKKMPIVMYCTGGIRCEKAAVLMQREGYQQVYQLAGGILQYFSECGDAHYEGKCFVFDDRVSVSAEDVERN